MTPLPPERIDTERLSLRLPKPSDTADIFEYASDEEVTLLMEWERCTEPGQVAGFLARTDDRRGAGSEYTWVVTERGEDRVIGAFALRPRPGEADFGYVLARRVWGRGIAVEASRAAIDWFRSNWRIPRIWATCDTENHRSARVLEKLGLKREVVIAGHLVRPNISMQPRDSCLYAWSSSSSIR